MAVAMEQKRSFSLPVKQEQSYGEGDDLRARIAEFKKANPEEFAELSLFVEDVLQQAQVKAQETQDNKAAEDSKIKNGNAASFINGLKNKRVVTRARSMAVRIFEVISNCTTQVQNPIQARLRRQQTTSAPTTRTPHFEI